LSSFNLFKGGAFECVREAKATTTATKEAEKRSKKLSLTFM